MAKKTEKRTAAQLVSRFQHLKEVSKPKLYAEMEAIVEECRKLPEKELFATGYRIKKAFEDGRSTEFGHGPVKEFDLVPLTKKEKAGRVA